MIGPPTKTVTMAATTRCLQPAGMPTAIESSLKRITEPMTAISVSRLVARTIPIRPRNRLNCETPLRRRPCRSPVVFRVAVSDGNVISDLEPNYPDSPAINSHGQILRSTPRESWARYLLAYTVFAIVPLGDQRGTRYGLAPVPTAPGIA